MIVKICGITNLDDAVAAVDAGADILGYNFFRGSPRYIAPEECLEIQQHLKGEGFEIRTAGIFVDTPADEIVEIHGFCELDLVQLSGAATPEQVIRVGVPAIVSIREPDYEAAILEVKGYADSPKEVRFIFDRLHPGVFGGTGEVGDWHLASQVASRFPILLAGGLSPENVQQACDEVQPWGVDVASGVESSPGRKDPVKMQAFVRAAKSVG